MTGDYVIRAGRLIDGTGSAPVERASVVVGGGMVRFAGRREDEPDAAADAVVIEAPELTVMPGLVDGHNGISGDWKNVKVLRCYLQYGVTTVISYSGNQAGEAPAVPLRDAVDQGLLRGCAGLVVGYMVNCTNGHNHGRTADGPWAVRRAVRELVQAGADFIKTSSSGGFSGAGERIQFPNYTREEMDAMVDEAHAWGVRVGVHAHTQPGLNRAIEAGADIIYHGRLIDQAAIERMTERGTWFIPTLRVTSRRNIDAHRHRPWMLEEMEAASAPHRAGFRQAMERGVPIAMGCDGPSSRYTWKYGEASVFELAELAHSGMTPLQAITAGTLQTARAYRIDDRVGSIEPGKQADLLCLQGDPLANIELLQDQSRVALVFRRGRVEYAGEAYKSHYTTRDDDEIIAYPR